jgi:hypothetical protein
MEVSMKILHIWNTAGVAGNIAKYLWDFYKIEGKVLMREQYDPFNLKTNQVEYVDGGSIQFYLRCYREAEKYDIIHFHSIDKWIKYFKLLYLGKQIILHYHGSDIRDKWLERERHWKHADKLLVSTPDLLIDAPAHAEYVPNMINHHLCNKYKDNEKIKGSAFSFHYGANDLVLKYNMMRKHRLNIMNDPRNPTPHDDFLKLLSRYEYYYDIKRSNEQVLQAFSVTALEALYMGVKVIAWNNRLISKLPKEFYPINLAREYIRIYEGLLW